MCCAGKICMLCTCLVMLVIAIGLMFGFGVFKKEFHKVKDNLHVSDPSFVHVRPIGPVFGLYAPPPF